MADHSSIEWTDATWNPVTGCSVVSPGCTNCYAMRLAGTRLKHHASRAGLTVETKAGPVWTGEVRFNEVWLDQPLRWKRPRRIFVCAHGDLFHEQVPDEWIDRVFAVMALAPQHIFQVLTKRAQRMRNYFWQDPVGRRGQIRFRVDVMLARSDRLEERLSFLRVWPLPNVWLGVSVEDQPRADERIPQLLATPAAVRFVSAESLLGPMDLTQSCAIWWGKRGPGAGPFDLKRRPLLDWVIVGGESGPSARPMRPDWVRGLRDQCQAAGVPFFFKQWGEFAPGDYRCFGENSVRLGKRAAGRVLDGREWNELPRG